ncbi:MULTISPECIES: acetylornithine deacetylase [Thiorhodovibrio]|uniref:acetylornithine deacetylase n=1 Tax=Thiorhodovibrio TaxID=61593 RepID=UPI00191396AC|nr:MULTISPECIES: acetylornithine deacetylase [Thiorhodovibrio]MBK5970760.1 acetylornithine deacetylase [Thiorhodovibrio winogradskyi]WPL14552.1 Acetylornithine deacetylase [Thiorhodovibrio litoralis]
MTAASSTVSLAPPTLSAGAPPLREMLAELIGTPSVSSVRPALDQSNRPLLDHLATWLEDGGFDVEILTLPGHPGKANLIATLGASKGDTSHGDGGLVLAGHSDTVPYDEHLWQHDPFTLTEADGRLYGLGTCDMKAFFALAIEAARGLQASQLRAPLTLLATADEESAMHGARALLDSGRHIGRHAVIGEPTNLRPVRAHKGVMGEAIRLRGQSGHASDPALGRSAIDGMHEVMGAILRWREQLQSRYRDDLFSVPYPSVNLGYIRGGDNPNRICGECELMLDLRPLPGMDPASLRAELEELIIPIAEARGLAWELDALFASIPPGATAAAAEIVRAAEKLTGMPAEAVNFGTELPFFNRLGMDTIVLGPGDIAQAHQPNEFLALERIEPTLTLLRSLIGHFCLSAAA